MKKILLWFLAWLLVLFIGWSFIQDDLARISNFEKLDAGDFAVQQKVDSDSPNSQNPCLEWECIEGASCSASNTNDDWIDGDIENCEPMECHTVSCIRWWVWWDSSDIPSNEFVCVYTPIDNCKPIASWPECWDWIVEGNEECEKWVNWIPPEYCNDDCKILSNLCNTVTFQCEIWLINTGDYSNVWCNPTSIIDFNNDGFDDNCVPIFCGNWQRDAWEECDGSEGCNEWCYCEEWYEREWLNSCVKTQDVCEIDVSTCDDENENTRDSLTTDDSTCECKNECIIEELFCDASQTVDEINCRCVDGPIFCPNGDFNGEEEWCGCPEWQDLIDGECAPIVIITDPVCWNGILEGSESCEYDLANNKTMFLDDSYSICNDFCNAIKLVCNANNDACVYAENWTSCDSSIDIDEDGIPDACDDQICSNWKKEVGEECDDGNDTNDDECSNDCVKNFCLDWALNNGEQCDSTDPTDPNRDSCDENCILIITSECTYSIEKRIISVNQAEGMEVPFAVDPNINVAPGDVITYALDITFSQECEAGEEVVIVDTASIWSNTFIPQERTVTANPWAVITDTYQVIVPDGLWTESCDELVNTAWDSSVSIQYSQAPSICVKKVPVQIIRNGVIFWSDNPRDVLATQGLTTPSGYSTEPVYPGDEIVYEFITWDAGEDGCGTVPDSIFDDNGQRNEELSSDANFYLSDQPNSQGWEPELTPTMSWTWINNLAPVVQNWDDDQTAWFDLVIWASAVTTDGFLDDTATFEGIDRENDDLLESWESAFVKSTVWSIDASYDGEHAGEICNDAALFDSSCNETRHWACVPLGEGTPPSDCDANTPGDQVIINGVCCDSTNGVTCDIICPAWEVMIDGVCCVNSNNDQICDTNCSEDTIVINEKIMEAKM